MSLKVTIEADNPEELAELLSLVATNYEAQDDKFDGDEEDEDDDGDDDAEGDE